MKPHTVDHFPQHCSPRTTGSTRLRAAAGLPCAALLLVLGLSACADGAISSGSGLTERAMDSGVAASEAATPIAMPTPSDAASGETVSTAEAPSAAVDPAGKRDADRSKDSPPPRVERQMGEIAEPSPSGFRLGSINVVIDGSTRIEPVNALAEGEPVDVTGYYESDRRTLRATVVRSTRPATEAVNPGAAESTTPSAG